MRMRAGVAVSMLVASLTAGQAAAQQMTREEFIERTYRRAGMLLRAGNICDEKQREYIEWSFKLQTLDDDVKSVAKRYPKLVQEWMTEGAQELNMFVAKEGLKPACFRAYIQVLNAAAAVLEEQKRQGR